MERTGQGAAKASSKNGSCPAELAVHGWDHDASKEWPPLDSTDAPSNAILSCSIQLRRGLYMLYKKICWNRKLCFFFFLHLRTQLPPLAAVVRCGRWRRSFCTWQVPVCNLCCENSCVLVQLCQHKYCVLTFVGFPLVTPQWTCRFPS